LDEPEESRKRGDKTKPPIGMAAGDLGLDIANDEASTDEGGESSRERAV
jgi:hypothetical protein